MPSTDCELAALPADSLARVGCVHKAWAATERTERVQLYERAQEIVFRDAPWVPLVHSTQTAAFQRGVTGFKLHPTGSKWFHSTALTP